MRTRILALLVSTGVMCGFSAGLQAQQAADERGWYGGIAVGGTGIKINDGALRMTGSTASSLTKDESSSVFALTLGYDFSRHWALEGGYADNGDFSAQRTSTAGTVGTFGANAKGTAWYLAGLGKLPLQNRFYLFGKLGVAATTTKTNLNTGGGFVLPAGTSTNRKKSESNLLWGLGAGVDFSRTFGLRLDYTRTDNVGDSSTGEGDVNTWTVGLKFRF